MVRVDLPRVAQNVPYDKLVEGIVLATSREPGQDYDDYCRQTSSFYYPDNDDADFADRDDDAPLLVAAQSASAGRKGAQLQLLLPGRARLSAPSATSTRSTSGPRRISTSSPRSSTRVATALQPRCPSSRTRRCRRTWAWRQEGKPAPARAARPRSRRGRSSPGRRCSFARRGQPQGRPGRRQQGDGQAEPPPITAKLLGGDVVELANSTTRASR